MPVKLVPVGTQGGGTLYEICASDPSTGQHIGIGYTALDIDGNPIAVALDSTIEESNALLTEIYAALAAVSTQATQENILLSLVALSGVIGNPADLAWSGTGSADIIPILKGTFDNVAKLATSGSGADASHLPPVLLDNLATFVVVNPGAFQVQNQSADVLQVIADDGAGGSTIFLLGSGGSGQSGDYLPPMPWFTGRIRINGPSGAQFAARHN